MYFSNHPKIPYRFCGCTSEENKVIFTNLILYSNIIDQISDDVSLYRFENTRDGERPDSLSQRLYGSPEYYWTFFLLNPELRKQGWPLGEKALEAKMKEDLPGECLVFLPQQSIFTGNNGFIQHPLIANFPVGETVFGQISGAAGVVYARNVHLGQLFVHKTNNIPFRDNEVVVNRINSAPTNQLTCRIAHNPAYLAVRHFEDGDGDHVDVDYALDFRGRASELVPENVAGLPSGAGPGPDGNYVGGVVGDLVNPDPYAQNQYSAVTFKEFYLAENDRLSRIKVFRDSYVRKFSELHKQSINR